jgi:hypothetical protein
VGTHRERDQRARSDDGGGVRVGVDDSVEVRDGGRDALLPRLVASGP